MLHCLAKRTTTLLTAVVCLALLRPLQTAAEETGRPTQTKKNIVILYADDLGYGDPGFNNPASRIATPKLDELAATGMRFTDAHSSSGICTPSRYALLTGRYHWRDFHSIVGPMGASVFKQGQLTMPGMLQKQGYSTACIGKWHLGWDWESIRNAGAQPVKNGKKVEWLADQFDWSKQIADGPLNHGFDSYFGDTVINFPPYCWIENDRVVDMPDTQMDPSQWPTIKEGNWECRPGPMVSGWNPYEVLPSLGDRAVQYIEKQSGSKKPFFLYFAFPSPHAPIIPNDEFDGKSSAGAYGDFVVETDHVAGRILEAIESAGLADNTIVIFTADNGPERYAYQRYLAHEHWSAEPFRGLKRDVYEGGHHVPMVVRWPGITHGGSQNNSLVSQVDVMATLAEYTGFALPEDAAVDSHSLMPTLRSPNTSVRESMVHNTYADRWGFRHDNWLLIAGKDGYHSRPNLQVETMRGYSKAAPAQSGFELYDLASDPGQRNDRSGSSPTKVAQLREKMAKARSGPTAPRLQ